MPNWVRIELYQTVNGVPADMTFDYRVSTEPTFSKLLNLLGTWDDVQLPAINALQHVGVRNVGAKAQWRGNAAVSYETGLGGGGTYDPGDAQIPLSQQSFYLRRYVGQSKEWSDDTVVTNRAIERGMMLMCGITEGWASAGQPDVPSTLDTALETFMDAMIATIEVGGVDNYIPVVHGFALEATGEPHPKTARPEVYADIVTVQFKRPTWVKGRTAF